MVGISSSIPSTWTACWGTPSSSSSSRSAVCRVVGILGVAHPTRKRDLPGVPTEVRGTEGEEEPRVVSPEHERREHGRVAQLEPRQVQVPTRVLLERLRQLDEPRVHQRGTGSLLAASAGILVGGVPGSSPASGRSRPVCKSERSSAPSRSR